MGKRSKGNTAEPAESDEFDHDERQRVESNEGAETVEKVNPPVVLGAEKEAAADPAKRGDVVTMTANQINEPRRTPQAPQPALTPEAAFPGEECAIMVSPRAFFVLLNDRRRVQFKKGPQKVPTSLQAHKYVKDNGVVPFTG